MAALTGRSSVLIPPKHSRASSTIPPSCTLSVSVGPAGGIGTNGTDVFDVCQGSPGSAPIVTGVTSTTLGAPLGGATYLIDVYEGSSGTDGFFAMGLILG